MLLIVDITSLNEKEYNSESFATGCNRQFVNTERCRSTEHFTKLQTKKHTTKII